MALLLIATGGTTTVGAPLVGWLSEVFNARVALAQGGVATALACGATFFYLRRRRTVQTPEQAVLPEPVMSTGRSRRTPDLGIVPLSDDVTFE